MRRNDAMWRQLLRKATRHKRRPALEQFEQRLLLSTTYIVDTTDDNPANLTENSLRNQIAKSNASPSTTAQPNVIQFNISSDGTPQTINLRQALPAITASVVIDGLSEPRSNGRPIVAINGANVTTGGGGLNITAGNSTVRGLSIVGFPNGSAITLSGAGGDTINANYLGVLIGGVATSGNNGSGIIVGAGASNSRIFNNVIGGNIGDGITVDGTVGGSGTSVVTGTQITNNRIGVDTTGTAALANRGYGVSVNNATGTTIGGSGGGNIISGNYTGIILTGTTDTTVIQSNLIGTDATGRVAIPNRSTVPTGSVPPASIPGEGINILDSSGGVTNVQIGGTTSDLANTISGNASNGIDISGGSGVTVQGNYVGTVTGGTAILSNGSAGISISSSTPVIGGTATGTGNVIGGNLGAGVTVSGVAAGTLIQGNYIGTNSSGAALGNGGSGVVLASSNGGVIVGGALVNGAVTGNPSVTNGVISGAANVIANNGAGVNGSQNLGGTDGIDVNSGISNTILSNSIYNNAQLGISVSQFNSGVVNPPTLISAVSNKTTSEFTGTFQGAPGTYFLQFFTTPLLNAASVAEGQSLIGTMMLTVTSTALQRFDLTLPVGFEPGGYVTATATDTNNSTSQFSAETLIGTGQGPNDIAPVVSVTGSPAAVNAGDNVTYTFTVTNNSAVVNRGVIFSAPLPAGTTLFSGSASISVFSNAAGGFVTTQVPVVVTNGVANVSLGNLQPAGSSAANFATVVLTLTTGAASAPSYTLTGGVSVTIPTFTAVNASTTTAVTPSDDLYAFVNGPATPVQVGQNATFEITVGNNGPSTGNNFLIADTLPAGTTFVAAAASNGAVLSFADGVLRGNLGPIAGGDLVTITLIVATTADTPALVVNTVGVSGDESDSDPTNNLGAATLAVIPSSDVAILSETVTPGAVTAGQQVTYTITVTNNGPSPANGVVVRDILPAGLTFVSGSAAGGAVSVAQGVVTAPVGSLAAGAQSVVTLTVLALGAGPLADQATITSAGADPNPANNNSSATVTVDPLTDLAVTLTGPTAPTIIGQTFQYTAIVTNTGPSPATNVVLTDALFAGAQFVAANDSNGNVGSSNGGIVTVPLGTIAAGQTVVVSIAVTPTLVGGFTSTATVAGAERDSNPGNNTSSTATSVVVPQFVIGFNKPTFVTPETSGFATIVLARSGDLTGDVTVLFSTTAGGNARPGIDYIPTSQLVTFPSGVQFQTVTVPVLANPNDSTNENVNLLLTSPTGSAIFGGGSTSGSATLTILNTDPLLSGPTVTDVRIVGPINAITGVEIQTTGKLNPTTATLASNYSFTSISNGAVIPVTTVAYDASTGKLFLLPASPLPAGQIFTLRINGTGPNAVVDLAGNPLNSSLIGSVAGSDFALNIARGKTLNYRDQNGVRVTLKLTGPGVLDLNQATNGLVERLQVVSPTKATRLTGSTAGGGRRTTIGSVVGLKLFGTVKTSLPTPPFYVTNTIYPNLQTLNNGVSSDTLLGANPGKPTKVKAKAISVAHPHAKAAQALHASTNAPKAKATHSK